MGLEASQPAVRVARASERSVDERGSAKANESASSLLQAGTEYNDDYIYAESSPKELCRDGRGGRSTCERVRPRTTLWNDMTSSMATRSSHNGDKTGRLVVRCSCPRAGQFARVDVVVQQLDVL